jgi:hypothetical protein
MDFHVDSISKPNGLTHPMPVTTTRERDNLDLLAGWENPSKEYNTRTSE